MQSLIKFDFVEAMESLIMLLIKDGECNMKDFINGEVIYEGIPTHYKNKNRNENTMVKVKLTAHGL